MLAKYSFSNSCAESISKKRVAQSIKHKKANQIAKNLCI